MTSYPGLRPVHIARGETLLVYRRDEVGAFSCIENNFNCYGRVNQPAAYRFLERFSVTKGLFRTGLHGLILLRDGSYLGTIRGAILRLEPDQTFFNVVLPVTRGSRPLNFCEAPNGRVYFGEYFSNPERSEVHIYCSCDSGRTWDVAYTFAAGEIRHIHGIFYDRFRDGLWVLTGDLDSESRILFSADHFENVDTIFQGSQSVRTVHIFPMKDALISATDTPYQENKILRLEPDSGRIDELQSVEGSVLYGCRAGDYFVFSSAVEPSKINRSSFASLWFSKYGETWKKLAAFQKNPLSGKFFQYAALPLPSGENNTNIAYAY
ncbi:MAG: hypothetical protein MI864_19075, partial [Pseudomonadales bacterium]|nr:hypothetical protein [Pseudomonadales bacterium]